MSNEGIKFLIPIFFKDLNSRNFKEESITENGFGIRLTQERIKLLNQMNKNNPIAISFDKNSEGMVVDLTYKDIC